MMTYWRQWRNWIVWWHKCDACGYRERRLVEATFVIPNEIAFGEPMMLDGSYCAGCATMFGWHP